MKKLLLLVAILLSLSSCVNQRVAHYMTVPTMVDFRPFAARGFYISPADNTAFKYDPVGIIEMIFVPGLTDKNAVGAYKEYVDGKINEQDLALIYVKSGDEFFFEPDDGYMMGQFVTYAKSKGANGLLSFSITKHYDMFPYLQHQKSNPDDPFESFVKHERQTYGYATIKAFAISILYK